MPDGSGGSDSGNSNKEINLGLSWGRFRTTVTDAVKDQKNRDAMLAFIRQGAASTLDLATDFASGVTKPETPKTDQTPAATTLPVMAVAPAAPAPAAAPAAPAPNAAAQAEKKKTEEAKEQQSLITSIMLKILPDGVKDWAATMAIPMATQGGHLIRKWGGKAPEIQDSPLAFLACMQGDKITVVPKAVHDYAKTILGWFDLQDDSLAMSISVGFIAFLRKYAAGIIPGVTAFNDASNVSVTSALGTLLGSSTKPETLLSVFKLMPAIKGTDPRIMGQEIVDPQLVGAMKMVFGQQNIPNIDSYFSEKMEYRQFLENYARLGRDMAATWKINPSRITDSLKEKANETLTKMDVTDNDGSLAEGLATAAVHSAELLNNLKKEPAAPAPVVATTAAKPPTGS